MEKKEIESIEFKDEWLDDDFNDHGSRRDNLGMADLEFTKSVYDAGGLDAVDAYLNSTANAYTCANDLIRVVDSLFNVTKFGTEDELYDRLVTKAIKEVFESMILALENAESSVQYDVDPLDRAEGYIRGFGYGLIDDLGSILSGELGRVAKADVGLESILRLYEQAEPDKLIALSPCPWCGGTKVFKWSDRKWHCPDCNTRISRAWKKDPLGRFGFGGKV